MTDSFPQTKRNRVARLPKRGHYDRATIYPIVDAALVCHVGFVQDGQPFVLPTLHARDGDDMLLHGATTSRMLRYIQEGHPICLTMTLVDGIVLARSVFHHSINYRSAVLFGRGELIDDPAERLSAMERLTERIMPGRWADARPPSAQELKATTMIRVVVESGSAKVRTGPPGDDPEDLELPYWSGVLPLHEVAGDPQHDPTLQPGIGVPAYLQEYRRRRAL